MVSGGPFGALLESPRDGDGAENGLECPEIAAPADRPAGSTHVPDATALL
jgi:hypothetical protein